MNLHRKVSSLQALGRQFIYFISVGALATALQYVILIALVQFAAVAPTPASTVGFAFSALGNYGLNRRFTFRSREPHAATIPKFAAVMTIGLAVNAVVIYVLTALNVYYIAAQVVATAVVLCWNFAANRWWTFSARANDAP